MIGDGSGNVMCLGVVIRSNEVAYRKEARAWDTNRLRDLVFHYQQSVELLVDHG